MSASAFNKLISNAQRNLAQTRGEAPLPARSQNRTYRQRPARSIKVRCPEPHCTHIEKLTFSGKSLSSTQIKILLEDLMWSYDPGTKVLRCSAHTINREV